jgi:uncharacterized protein (TIGR03067 family)
MRLTAFAALTAALVSAPAWCHAKDDKAPFDGTWKVTKLEFPPDLAEEGKAITEQVTKHVTVTVKGDAATGKHAEKAEELKGTFKVAADKIPKEIDFTAAPREGSGRKPEMVKGIYKMDGDTLVIAVAIGENVPRPTEFKPSGTKAAMGGVIILHLKKQK